MHAYAHQHLGTVGVGGLDTALMYWPPLCRSSSVSDRYAHTYTYAHTHHYPCHPLLELKVGEGNTKVCDQSFPHLQTTMTGLSNDACWSHQKTRTHGRCGRSFVGWGTWGPSVPTGLTPPPGGTLRGHQGQHQDYERPEQGLPSLVQSYWLQMERHMQLF